MHLVDNLVLRIGESTYGSSILSGSSCPSYSPVVAFNCNTLRGCPRCTDTVDSGLIDIYNKTLVHIMVEIKRVDALAQRSVQRIRRQILTSIVGVKYYLAVARKSSSKGLPK